MSAEAQSRQLSAQLLDKTSLLQTTLTHITQGILVFDAQARVILFNARVCELLDVPAKFLASQPSLQVLSRFQADRGDFGPDAQWVETGARAYVKAEGLGELPLHYLRKTHAGRTLEVRSQPLDTGGMVRTFADVTDYVQAESARKRLNQLLFATQALAQMGGWEINLITLQETWTDGIYRLFETTPQQHPPGQASIKQFLTPESLALVKESYADVVRQPKSHDFEVEMITATGRHIWVHSMGTTTWENGRPIKRMAIVQDVTRRRQTEAALRESEERWKLAMESIGDGLWDWQVQTGAEYLSPNLLRIYGFSEGELRHHVQELEQRTHPQDIAQQQRDQQAHFDRLTPTYTNEHRILCKNGTWKWVLSRGMVITRDAQDKPLRMIGTHTDITERKNAESLIWQQAHFDILTNLPNRRMLRERLEQELKKSRRDGLQLAILFIDLDHFKEVNDTLGHNRGDDLLIEAAQRIQRCVREVDTVARMGGDEFTVLVTELQTTDHLEKILLKLLRMLGEAFHLEQEQVFVSASIGVTVYPGDATEVEELLKNADQALYVAKGAGRNRFSFFTPALQQAAQKRVRLTHDLREALVAEQFRVVYQPIVELVSGSIHKAEALIRWQHPTRGLVSPADFIPIAESSGLIVDIGEWIFRQAAQQVQIWRQKLHPQFQISVNKSPVQFQSPNAAHQPWIDQLRSIGLTGDSIVVEITEGLLLSTSDGVIEQLLQLSDEGIGVSLDDFGTGYSSLSYLQKFDIDFVKIDQSFVRHLIAGSTDLALCNAIIVMAHALGMKVIAEGVETALQRDLLATAGCDYAQGYFYSRPVSAPEFEALLQRLTVDPS